jgi:hypothetical protein
MIDSQNPPRETAAGFLFLRLDPDQGRLPPLARTLMRAKDRA